MIRFRKTAGLKIFILLNILICFWIVEKGFSETRDAIPETEIIIPLYKSYYISTPPLPVKTVSVGNPNIADVKIITPRDIIIEAISPGVTTVFLWFVEHDDAWMVIGRPICMKYIVKITTDIQVETIKGTAVCPACSLHEWQCDSSKSRQYNINQSKPELINQKIKIIEADVINE